MVVALFPGLTNLCVDVQIHCLWTTATCLDGQIDFCFCVEMAMIDSSTVCSETKQPVVR